MSLVGSISLSNNDNGLYLGKVNIDNLNVSADQLLYSVDGVNISGLNLGNGLEKVDDELKTIGNPDIQLTSNSIYVNDNVSSINTAIENAEQADVIYVSSGSYSESGQRLYFYNKYNIALKCPDVGNTITEVLNGLDVTGTSELIRISNLQIEENKTNASSVIEGTGRYYFKNVTFTGTITSTHTIELGQNVTKFITFMNCEWDEYCDMYISAQLFSQIYFINCNFGNCNITYNNISPLLVIMSNCAGLKAMPTSVQATLIGVNVLTTGVSHLDTTNVNIPAVGSLNFAAGADISINGQSSADLVNYVPTADGASGLKWSVYAPSLFFVDSYSGQLSASGPDNPLTIFQKASQINIIQDKPTIMMFSLNITISGGADVLTLTLQNDDDSSTLASLAFNVGGGSHTIAGQFNFTMPSIYTLNYSIIGTIVTHNISTNTSSAYGITIYQNLV
jgi:hypothetical protein